MLKLLESKKQQWKQKLKDLLSLRELFPQKNKLLLLPILLVAVSCTTLPENFSEHTEGSWRAKSLIQDLKKRKSYVVYIDINAISPDKVRMDVETSLGIHIASFAYNKDRVQILVPEQRRFYSGKSSPKAFRKVIPLDLDPKWLLNILFEKNLEAKNWNCKKDDKGQWASCKLKSLSIKWVKRKRQMRVISFETKAAKVQLQLKGFEKTAKQDGFYKLKKPSSFKSYRL